MSWCNASKRLKIWQWDGAACAPLVLFLLHPRLWTLITLLIIAFGLTLLARRGYPVNAILRGLRASCAANPRYIRSPYRANGLTYRSPADGA